MVRKKRQPKITKVNRPPLTKKALSAIALYVKLKNNYPTVDTTVNLTLQADRMPREKLYSYLQYRGYKWKTLQGYAHKYWMKN